LDYFLVAALAAAGLALAAGFVFAATAVTPSTDSFSALAGVKRSRVRAGILICSPVAGLRPTPGGELTLAKYADRGQVLFDRRLGHPGTELLNIGGYAPWPDGFQPQASLLVPTEELPDSQGVGHPGVAVPDVGGEELDEAFAGVRTRCGDRGGQ
jgi:hypothetical protein